MILSQTYRVKTGPIDDLALEIDERNPSDFNPVEDLLVEAAEFSNQELEAMNFRSLECPVGFGEKGVGGFLRLGFEFSSTLALRQLKIIETR